MLKSNLKTVIDIAIKTEEQAAEFYSKHAAEYESLPEIRDIFQKLAKDEESHQVEFSKLVKQLEGLEEDIPQEEINLLQAVNPARFFKLLKSKGAKTLKEDVLECAYRFEKESLFFYQNLRETLGASPYIDKLIKSEKKHVSILLGYLATNAEFKGLISAW